MGDVFKMKKAITLNSFVEFSSDESNYITAWMNSLNREHLQTSMRTLDRNLIEVLKKNRIKFWGP